MDTPPLAVGAQIPLPPHPTVRRMYTREDIVRLAAIDAEYEHRYAPPQPFLRMPMLPYFMPKLYDPLPSPSPPPHTTETTTTKGPGADRQQKPPIRPRSNSITSNISRASSRPTTKEGQQPLGSISSNLSSSTGRLSKRPSIVKEDSLSSSSRRQPGSKPSSRPQTPIMKPLTLSDQQVNIPPPTPTLLSSRSRSNSTSSLHGQPLLSARGGGAGAIETPRTPKSRSNSRRATPRGTPRAVKPTPSAAPPTIPPLAAKEIPTQTSPRFNSITSSDPSSRPSQVTFPPPVPILSPLEGPISSRLSSSSNRPPRSESLLCQLSTAAAQTVSANADQLGDMILDHILEDTVHALNVLEEEKARDRVHQVATKDLSVAWEIVQQLEKERDEIEQRFQTLPRTPLPVLRSTTTSINVPAEPQPVPVSVPSRSKFEPERPASKIEPERKTSIPAKELTIPPSIANVDHRAAASIDDSPVPPSVGVPLPSLPSLVEEVQSNLRTYDAYQTALASAQFLQPHQIGLHEIVQAVSDDILSELIQHTCEEVGTICDGYVERVFEQEFQVDLEQMVEQDVQDQQQPHHQHYAADTSYAQEEQQHVHEQSYDQQLQHGHEHEHEAEYSREEQYSHQEDEEQ